MNCLEWSGDRDRCFTVLFFVASVKIRPGPKVTWQDFIQGWLRVRVSTVKQTTTSRGFHEHAPLCRWRLRYITHLYIFATELCIFRQGHTHGCIGMCDTHLYPDPFYAVTSSSHGCSNQDSPAGMTSRVSTQHPAWDSRLMRPLLLPVRHLAAVMDVDLL